MKDISRGINISGDLDRADFARKMGLAGEFMVALPVDSYPPNPLGLYDMAGNGYEWVNDWYDPDYYKHSPVVDPRDQKNRCINVVRILMIQRVSIRRYCEGQVFQDIFGV